MSHYLRVFNFLWRAKRMEYTLTDIWKGQMCNAKLLKTMPGVLLLCPHHKFNSEYVQKKKKKHVAAVVLSLLLTFWNFVFFKPPELSGVLHQCHVLAAEMVHFIHQMQYYITFEVSL